MIHSCAFLNNVNFARPAFYIFDLFTGWDGITKATPLKWYPPEEPNRTDPNDVIKKLEQGHRATRKANLNNIRIKEEKFLELFEALRHNASLEELTIANTTLSDFAAANLACAIQDNIRLEKLNLESNNVSPNTLSKIFEVLNNRHFWKLFQHSFCVLNTK